MSSPVEELTALPGGDTPWYKHSHLRKLNFITLSMVLFCKSPQRHFYPTYIPTQTHLLRVFLNTASLRVYHCIKGPYAFGIYTD